jgi:hypothetical protein
MRSTHEACEPPSRRRGYPQTTGQASALFTSTCESRDSNHIRKVLY